MKYLVWLLPLLLVLAGCDLSGDGLMSMVPSFLIGSALGTTVLAPIAEVIGNVIGDIQMIVTDADYNLSMNLRSSSSVIMYAQGGAAFTGYG